MLLLAIIKSQIKRKNNNMVMIHANAHFITCLFKKAQVFAIFVRDWKYQAQKPAQVVTNLKSFIS